MNIKILKGSFLVAVLSVLLTGCSTSGISQSDYDKRVITMEMGMSKKEFASLFPEVKPRGAKRYPGGTVEVLELLVDEYSFIPSGHKKRNPLTGMESTVTWFYFYNNKLIQYGQPQDWPAEPDTIIEVR